MLRRIGSRVAAAPLSRGVVVLGSCRIASQQYLPSVGSTSSLQLGGPSRQQWVQCRHSSSSSGDAFDDEDEGFEFDAAASLGRDVRRERKTQSIAELVASILPPNPPDGATVKLTEYFAKFPINDSIVPDQVMLTHRFHAGTGEERKVNMKMSIDEALKCAADDGVDLVQLAERDGIAYCRTRDEKSRALGMVQDILDQAGVSSSGNPGASSAQRSHQPSGANFKLQKPIEHDFRDVVDNHFVNWKSTKMVSELAKGHPLKLRMTRFTSPEAAIVKMRQMLNAIKTKATEENISHNATQVSISDRELSVTVTPVDPAKNKGIKHPKDADWNNHLNRLAAARGDGPEGTYVRRIKQSKLSTAHGKSNYISEDGTVQRMERSAVNKLKSEVHAKRKND